MNVRYFVALGTIVLFFLSCTKHSDQLHPNVIGKWEMASSRGGWAGHQTYSHGNGNTISFTKTTYTQTVSYNDSIHVISGVYSIYEGDYCQNSTNHILLQLDGYTIGIISVSGASLTIAPPECILDASSVTYRKIFL